MAANEYAAFAAFYDRLTGDVDYAGLAAYLREIFLPDGILFLRLCHHRFDRHTAEAQICKFRHVFGEIQIMTGKCSADVIIPVASHLGKLLELGND